MWEGKAKHCDLISHHSPGAHDGEGYYPCAHAGSPYVLGRCNGDGPWPPNHSARLGVTCQARVAEVHYLICLTLDATVFVSRPSLNCWDCSMKYRMPSFLIALHAARSLILYFIWAKGSAHGSVPGVSWSTDHSKQVSIPCLALITRQYRTHHKSCRGAPRDVGLVIVLYQTATYGERPSYTIYDRRSMPYLSLTSQVSLTAHTTSSSSSASTLWP